VSNLELIVSDDPASVVAHLLAAQAHGGGHIVLTGGSTPGRAYELAAAQEPDWNRVELWWGDERCVPPDDERSNYGMARDALLEPLHERARGLQVHRMKGELGPHAGAEDYERQLEEAGSPEFELLLLGIGPDGHTASLFPGQDTVHERSRLVVPVPEAGLEPFVPRISFTFATIARAQKVVVLATGAEKAHAVAAAFGSGAAPDPQVPSSFLPVTARELIVLLDAPAAAALDGPL
jgi:6-phosphogluconolactonase